VLILCVNLKNIKCAMPFYYKGFARNLSANKRKISADKCADRNFVLECVLLYFALLCGTAPNPEICSVLGVLNEKSLFEKRLLK
jgi:hypothetical protein